MPKDGLKKTKLGNNKLKGSKYSNNNRDSAGRRLMQRKSHFRAPFNIILKVTDFSNICAYSLTDLANPVRNATEVLNNPTSKKESQGLCTHIEYDCAFMSRIAKQEDMGERGVLWGCKFCNHTHRSKQHILTHFYSQHKDDVSIKCHFCDYEDKIEAIKDHHIQRHVLDQMENFEIPIKNSEATPIIGMTAFETYIRSGINNVDGSQPMSLNVKHCLKHLQSNCADRDRILFAFNLRQLCLKRGKHAMT